MEDNNFDGMFHDVKSLLNFVWRVSFVEFSLEKIKVDEEFEELQERKIRV